MFIAFLSGMSNRSSRIVCIGVRWNLLEQRGGALGVGYGWGMRTGKRKTMGVGMFLCLVQ